MRRRAWPTVVTVAFWGLVAGGAWVDLKPGSVRLARIVDMSHGLLSLGAICMVAMGLGLSLSRVLGLRYSGAVESVAFSFALGSGAITMAVFALASAHLLTKWIVVVVLVCAGVLTSRQVVHWLRGVVHTTRRSIRLSLYELVLFSVLVGCAGCTWLASRCPPLHYDALNYHLAFPAKYLRNGGFMHIPGHFYASYPANMGMLYAVALCLKCGALAKQVHWLFGVASAAAVYALARGSSDRRGALMAAGLFYVSPVVLSVSCFGLSDMASTFYSVLSLGAVIRWRSERQWSWLGVSAALCGLAMGTKYQALLFTAVPVGLVACFAACGGERRGWRATVRGISFGFAFGASALTVMGPWLLKNAVCTGNPVYPYLNGLFGEPLPFIGARHELLGRLPRGGGSVALAAYYARSFIALWSSELSAMCWLGPCFLAYLPFLISVRWRLWASRALAAFLALSIVIWVATIHETRYFLPGLVSLSVLLGQGVSAASVRARIRLIAMWCLPPLLATNLAATAWNMEKRIGLLDYIVGRAPARVFLDDKVDYYRTARYINECTPPRSRVLFVGLGRGYFCQRDYVATTLTESNPLFEAVRASQQAEEAAARLRALGFTHLLVRSAGLRSAECWRDWHRLYGLKSSKHWAIYRDLLSENYTPPIFIHGGIELREIRSP